MNGMSKIAMAAALALSFGNAQAQAARTGKDVLNANTNQWQPGALTGTTYISGTQVNSQTGTFHAGGVAACDGCHVMHNASSGVARSTKVAPWTNAVPAFLLQGSDQSSTCLVCHGDNVPGGNANPYVIMNTSNSAANMNFSPGGDFGWLTTAGGAGARSGHNVVAMDFGIAADTGSMLTAPGGTFNTTGTGVAAFACSNCHDPHGRFRMQYVDAATWQWAGPTAVAGMVVGINQPIYSSGSYGNVPTALGAVGAYRLLAGVGYSPASMVTGAFPFVNNPPVAVAPPSYNHTEGGGKANEVRVAYGAGMSEWCQNCHTNIHLDNYVSGAMGASGLRHPAGSGAFLKPGQVNVYNTYISSGKFNGTGDQYTSLVPFENAGKVTITGAGGTMAGLTTLAAAAGGTNAAIFTASNDSNVMCLSCHRAHASGFSSMGRWNFDDTFITSADTVNFVDTATPARTNVTLARAYYGRTPADFGLYQRSMCNKCHGKD
jgi:hypothetical protein